MSAPFKHFTVSITTNPNEFIVRLTDLAKSLEEFEKPPTELDGYRHSLKRALFIEQAIEEKMASNENR